MRSSIYIMLLFLLSCGTGLAPEAYIRYVEEDAYPYKITKEIGDKRFTLIYTPNEYLVVKSTNGKVEDKTSFDQEIKSKEDFIHFVFIVEAEKNTDVITPETGDKDGYNEKLMYMMSDIQNDFVLKNDGATLPCVFANFERNHGLSNKNNIQVVFQRPVFEKEIKVIYNDRLFNIGPVVFDFKKIENKKVKI